MQICEGSKRVGVIKICEGALVSVRMAGAYWACNARRIARAARRLRVVGGAVRRGVRSYHCCRVWCAETASCYNTGHCDTEPAQRILEERAFSWPDLVRQAGFTPERASENGFWKHVEP